MAYEKSVEGNPFIIRKICNESWKEKVTHGTTYWYLA